MSWQLVINPQLTYGWYPHWIAGLQAGFVVHDERLFVGGYFDSDRDGPIILSHHSTFDLLDMMQDGQAILVEHDTLTPVTTQADPGTIARYQHRAVGAVAVLTERMAYYVQHVLACPKPVIMLGCPYANPALDAAVELMHLDYAERPKLAIFPQRLEPFNQPPIAARLALALRRAGWTVAFLSPTPAAPGLPVTSWQRAGIQVFTEAREAEFYRFARQARLAISTSAGGGVCVAGYEAWRLGCQPVIPVGEYDLPPWSDPYDMAYGADNPSSALELIAAIEEGFPVGVDPRYFEPSACVTRLLHTWEASR